MDLHHPDAAAFGMSADKENGPVLRSPARRRSSIVQHAVMSPATAPVATEEVQLGSAGKRRAFGDISAEESNFRRSKRSSILVSGSPMKKVAKVQKRRVSFAPAGSTEEDNVRSDGGALTSRTPEREDKMARFRQSLQLGQSKSLQDFLDEAGCPLDGSFSSDAGLSPVALSTGMDDSLLDLSSITGGFSIPDIDSTSEKRSSMSSLVSPSRRKSLDSFQTLGFKPYEDSPAREAVAPSPGSSNLKSDVSAVVCANQKLLEDAELTEMMELTQTYGKILSKEQEEQDAVEGEEAKKDQEEEEEVESSMMEMTTVYGPGLKPLQTGVPPTAGSRRLGEIKKRISLSASDFGLIPDESGVFGDEADEEDGGEEENMQDASSAMDMSMDLTQVHGRILSSGDEGCSMEMTEVHGGLMTGEDANENSAMEMTEMHGCSPVAYTRESNQEKESSAMEMGTPSRQPPTSPGILCRTPPAAKSPITPRSAPRSARSATAADLLASIEKIRVVRRTPIKEVSEEISAQYKGYKLAVADIIAMHNGESPVGYASSRIPSSQWTVSDFLNKADVHFPIDELSKRRATSFGGNLGAGKLIEDMDSAELLRLGACIVPNLGSLEENCAYLEEEVDHLAQSIRALEENIDENHPVLYSELEKYSDTPKEALIQNLLLALKDKSKERAQIRWCEMSVHFHQTLQTGRLRELDELLTEDVESLRAIHQQLEATKEQVMQDKEFLSNIISQHREMCQAKEDLTQRLQDLRDNAAAQMEAKEIAQRHLQTVLSENQEKMLEKQQLEKELESLEAEFSNEESEEQLLSLVDKERELLSIASSANGFRLESSDHSGMLISLADGAGLLSMTYTEDGEHATTTFQTATASVPGSFTAGLKNTALSPELTALVHQWAVPELQSAHATPLEVQEMIFRAVGLVDRFSSFQGQVEMLNREFGGLWLAKSESNSEQLTLVIEVDQTDFRCKYQVQLAVNPCSWEGVRVDAPSKVKGGVASSSAGAIASTVQGQDEMDSMHKTPEGVVFSFKNLSGKTSARGISQAISGVVTDVNAGSRDGQSLLQRLTTALHEWPAMSAPLMRSPGVAE